MTANDPRSVLRRAARSATAPVRGYINDHFEMVKQEVRASGSGPAPTGDPAAWDRVAELESVLAEQSLHQARVLARLADEVAAMSARVGELEAVVRRLAEITAAPVPDA